MPPVIWPAVLLGAAIGIGGSLFVVPFIAAPIGALVAGRLARTGSAYQGAIVAALTIVVLALLPRNEDVSTVAILVADLLTLILGATAGWVGGLLRPSSGDKGRGRARGKRGTRG